MTLAVGWTPRKETYSARAAICNNFGGVTRALIVRYGDVPGSERRPKIGSAKRSSPEYKATGIGPCRIGLRACQSCRRIFGYDLARVSALDLGHKL